MQERTSMYCLCAIPSHQHSIIHAVTHERTVKIFSLFKVWTSNKQSPNYSPDHLDRHHTWASIRVAVRDGSASQHLSWDPAAEFGFLWLLALVTPGEQFTSHKSRSDGDSQGCLKFTHLSLCAGIKGDLSLSLWRVCLCKHGTRGADFVLAFLALQVYN